MDQEIYSNLKAKTRNNVEMRKSLYDGIEENISLESLLDKKRHSLLQSDLNNSFCMSLKKLLEINDLTALIEELMKFDHILEELELSYIELEVPRLDRLYQRLSPLLLRSLWEREKLDNNIENITNGWLQALKVALETELFDWMEK